jgi:hypothetical protein
MLTRSEVLQPMIDLFASPSYLEVGVYEGTTFFQIIANRKVAVDPHFRFRCEKHDPTQLFYEVPSDDFFGNLISAEEEFDVIFLDGLHTFEQTLRDLLNSLHFLRPHGVIVIDDVLPNSYQSSLASHDAFRSVKAFLDSADESWMGDVFKLVFFIQTFLQQFSYATVRENRGQLVLWRQQRPSNKIVQREMRAVASLEFADIAVQIDQMNLLPYEDILASIKSTLPTSS